MEGIEQLLTWTSKGPYFITVQIEFVLEGRRAAEKYIGASSLDTY